MVADALPRLLAAPDDLDARSDMLYGAYLAGAALTGGFALQHAIAHMLGGSFGIEHGVGARRGAALRHRAPRGGLAPEPLGRIAAAVARRATSPGCLWDLVGRAGLPLRLADVGVGPADLDRAVEIATTAEDHDDPRLAGNPGARHRGRRRRDPARPRPPVAAGRAR